MRYLKFVFLALCIGFCCSDSDKEYKDRLIEVAKRCYERELTSGTGGDISVRIPGTDRFIIKATQNCFYDLDDNKLTIVNLEGKIIDGPEPSHETPIHADIYKMRPEVGAIMHMHSPYATAWGCIGKTIPPVTQQSVNLLKNTGIVSYAPVGSEKLLESIVSYYKNPEITVVMMENHGTFVVAPDLYELLYRGEVVENTARIAYFAKNMGEVKSFEFRSIE